MENLYSWNKRGTRMLIDTGYRRFDKQTNYVSYGNVISNTQYSMYIRDKFETECNGSNCETGELRNFDLEYFTKYFDNNMKEFFNQFFGRCCLYEFSVYNKKNNQREVIGWLVFDYSHTHLLKYHVNDYFRFLDKGNKVLDKMQKIIENHTTRVKEMKGVI
ncbi:MAG: hypothetical protein J6T10_24085 [Methanobrevibacter sp.]|nr:hypothetical protein [Methanobrevibacter sp.]